MARNVQRTSLRAPAAATIRDKIARVLGDSRIAIRAAVIPPFVETTNLPRFSRSGVT